MKNINSPVKMNNGLTIPVVGYGTFQTPPDETFRAVTEAIKIGYRHIDTAAFYFNEEGVGKAVRESGLPREDFFVTTKVWNSERGYDKVMASFEASMKKLDIEYLDLLLVHWPANYLQYGKEAKKLNADTWRAFEDLYRSGRVKSIGLSNFLTHHIEDLMETAEIKPQVDQIEFHPGWNQRGTVRCCHDNDIVVEAWSPMGSGAVLQDGRLAAPHQRFLQDGEELVPPFEGRHRAFPGAARIPAFRAHVCHTKGKLALYYPLLKSQGDPYIPYHTLDTFLL